MGLALTREGGATNHHALCPGSQLLNLLSGSMSDPPPFHNPLLWLSTVPTLWQGVLGHGISWFSNPKKISVSNPAWQQMPSLPCSLWSCFTPPAMGMLLYLCHLSATHGGLISQNSMRYEYLLFSSPQSSSVSNYTWWQNPMASRWLLVLEQSISHGLCTVSTVILWHWNLLSQEKVKPPTTMPITAQTPGCLNFSTYPHLILSCSATTSCGHLLSRQCGYVT
jgi:hypothetical protein